MNNSAKMKAMERLKEILKDSKAVHKKDYTGLITTKESKIKLYGMPELHPSGGGVEIHYKIITGRKENKNDKGVVVSIQPIVESKVEVFK